MLVSKNSATVIRTALCMVSAMVAVAGIVGCSGKKEEANAAPAAPPVNAEAQKAKIQNDPNIPAAQKEMLIKQIDNKSAAAPPK